MRNKDKKLALELIEKRCGTHSLGLVYEFLLKVCHDSHEAEAQFVKFISGELPQRLLEEARLWVGVEQTCSPSSPVPSTNADRRELIPG